MVAFAPTGRVEIGGIGIDSFTEGQVVRSIIESLDGGLGGWVVTPNIDICRKVRHDLTLARLVDDASFAIPDGMPIIWAARLLELPLGERVPGSSLIFSLSEAAAQSAKSIYLLGGMPGIAEEAARRLSGQYPGLTVAGAYGPPLGFDSMPGGNEQVGAKLAEAAPDIVFVGLGFPRQELLISRLLPMFPNTWFVACGAALAYAAGALPRPPRWVQDAGLEWVFRLVHEPKRLFRRYVLLDLPFASVLLLAALRDRLAAAARFRGSHRGPIVR